MPRMASSSTGVLTCWRTATAGTLRRDDAWSVTSSRPEAMPSTSTRGSQRRIALRSGEWSFMVGESDIEVGERAGGGIIELIGAPQGIEPVGEVIGREPPLGRPLDVEFDAAAVHEDQPIAE